MLTKLSLEEMLCLINEIDFWFFKQADEDVLISPELLIVLGDEVTEHESQLEAVSQRSR